MNNGKGKRRIATFFSRLTVSRKIALGFAIVLALHLSVVFLGHYGLRKAERDRLTQSELLQQVEVFFEIDRVVAELQRNVLLYAFTGYSGPGGRVDALHTQLGELLDEASEAEDEDLVSTIAPERVEAMRRGLARHREIFRSVVVDRAKRRSLLEKDLQSLQLDFERSLIGVREEIAARGSAVSAHASFLAAQLDVMRFVNNPDSALVRDAKQRLDEAKSHLAQLEESWPGAAAEAATAVDGYELAFIQMVQATRGYLHLVNVVLAGESEEFLHLAKSIRNDCAAHADHLSEAIRLNSDRFEALNTVVSVLTILLGLFASWVISRDVAPPLNAITTTIDLLAKGRECDRIPGLDRGDELGSLARAAEVFRAKAEETQRLLEEVTRMKEAERLTAHSQKMESVGQLAAGIAHEINTPMQAVATNLEYLTDATDCLLQTVDVVCDSLDDENACSIEWRHRLAEETSGRRFTMARKEVAQAIEDSASAAKRVVEIVRAMKAMSHPGALNFEATDVNQLVRDAATISRNRWKYSATLELELDENLPIVEGMPSMLSQVVLNLIVNAADAINECEDRPEELGAITVRSYCDADAVNLDVSDTGAGIPEEVRDRIFEPFFTTKDVGKGTGQGLAVCYDAVVRRHHGTLGVESQVGVGTTFSVSIPIVPPAENEPIKATTESLQKA